MLTEAEDPSRVVASEASGDSGLTESPHNEAPALAAGTPCPVTQVGGGKGEAQDGPGELPVNVENTLAGDRDGEPPEAPPEPQ